MSKRRGTKKIIFVAILVSLAFAGVFARLLFLHLKFSDPFQETLQESRKVTLKLEPRRGRIMDRQGNIFALDVRLYHVILDPLRILDASKVNELSNLLAPLLDLNANEIEQEILRRAPNRSGNRYYRLKKYVSDETVSKLREALKATELSGLPRNSVYFEEAFKRLYPKDSLMSHVVGYSNDNGFGCAGVELTWNNLLTGTAGEMNTEVDGRNCEIYSRREVIKDPVNGADVYLTLDQELQFITETALYESYVKSKAKGAFAIIQRVRTGEILAMASFPNYDLNNYGKATTAQLRNRALYDIYEPGSTMKSVSIASAINHGVVVPEEIIDCEAGVWYYAGRSLEEYRRHNYGELSVGDILKKSSNIGTAKIVIRMGDRKLDEYLRAFNFASRLNCGLEGEATGLLNPYSKWKPIDITRICIGHSISVTALQMVNAMSCIANEGRLMRPTVVHKVVKPDGTVAHQFRPEIIGRPIRPDVARTMWRLMSRVTEPGGTGTTAKVPGYKIAGKSGTATKHFERVGYILGKNMASFAGFLPADNPEISIIVVVDEPVGVRTGGALSGPIFKKIAEQTMKYLGIPPMEFNEDTQSHLL